MYFMPARITAVIRYLLSGNQLTGAPTGQLKIVKNLHAENAKQFETTHFILELLNKF